MKKYLLPSFAGLAIVFAGALLSPLSAAADPYVPVGPCTQSCTSSTVNVPDSAAGSGLADTGSTISLALLGGAGAAVLVGGAVVVVARKRAHRSS